MKVIKHKQRNRNHYVCEVLERLNGGASIYNAYFVGTQAQAIAHFSKHERIKKYIKADRYRIMMRANSIAFDKNGAY